MKRVWLYAVAGGALAGIIAVAILGISFATGGTGTPESDVAREVDSPVEASVVDTAATGDSGGTIEGVAVHGLWEIEVRNADGSLDDRYVFENALTSSGQMYLVGLLSRNFGLPGWGILLINSTGGPGPCGELAGVGADCLIVEESPGPGISGWPGVTFYNTLTISPTSPGGTTLTLTGTANAVSDGSIDKVGSVMCVSLPASLDPSVCNNGAEFTMRTLNVPVTVSTGQQIFVTVSITFS